MNSQDYISEENNGIIMGIGQSTGDLVIDEARFELNSTLQAGDRVCVARSGNGSWVVLCKVVNV